MAGVMHGKLETATRKTERTDNESPLATQTSTKQREYVELGRARA